MQGTVCNAGEAASVLGSGGSPGEGNGYPLQLFLSGKFHGQKSLAGYSLGVPRAGHDSATKPPPAAAQGEAGCAAPGEPESGVRALRAEHPRAVSPCHLPGSCLPVLWEKPRFPLGASSPSRPGAGMCPRRVVKAGHPLATSTQRLGTYPWDRKLLLTDISSSL